MAEETTPSVRDTGPLSSKKFLALIFALFTNKVVMLCALFVIKDNVEAGSAWMMWWLITLTLSDGFIAVGGILGIAYVDRYVRVAQIMAKGPKGALPVKDDDEEPEADPS